MPRLDRGIQYAAASRFNHDGLWNTGSSAFADDDTKCVAALSSRQLRCVYRSGPNLNLPSPSRYGPLRM
jgi:hypothetical protein